MTKLLILFFSTINLFASDYEMNAMDFYPSHYMNRKTNKPDGIIINVIEKALSEVNKTVTFNILPIKRCIHTISHENQMACATLPLGKNSQYQNIIFNKEPVSYKKSKVYLLSIKKQNSKKFKLEDLKDKSVSLFESDDLYYKNKLLSLHAKPILLATDIIALKFLKNIQSDYALLFEQTFDHLPLEEQNIYEKVYSFDVITGHVAFNPKHPQTNRAIADLDRGLKKIKENGILKKMTDEAAKNLKIKNK